MPPPEIPKHSQASLAQSLVGVTAPFSWALMCTRFCCAPEESLSPQSWGSSVMKSCQLSNSDSLGIPSPFTRSPGQTGSLLWGLEVLRQCENFFGMIVLQFVGRPPGSSSGANAVPFKRAYTTCHASQAAAAPPHSRPLLVQPPQGIIKLSKTGLAQPPVGSLLLSLGPGAHKVWLVPSKNLWSV